MVKHVLKPWKEVCILRDEIRTKTLTMADFAVDLHRVIFEPGGGKYYTDPEAFFAASYATPNLRRFCRDVLRRLAKEDGGEPIINVAQNPHSPQRRRRRQPTTAAPRPSSAQVDGSGIRR